MSPPDRPQRPTRQNGDQTREKILDAAEALFGAQGFAAVSLRDITKEAGVTLALASYHFGTKTNLFEAVVARRAAVLCAERQARLAALDAPDTRAILDTFFAPLFDKARSGEPGWPHYFRVLARLGEGDEGALLLATHFDPTAQAFILALRAAIPDADPDGLARGFAMALHAMLAAVSRHARVTALSGGSVSADDLDAAERALLSFATAGVESAARPR
ncbi:MAG: TetR family transcriptional regulator [Pseudomonadota bacterium]|nr:TetR family transcriptional regulator [Pseudomonadota bacterium]